MTDKMELERRELLPCPFCGSEANLLSVDSNRAKTWYVECANENCCSKPGYSRRDQNEALATWNRRLQGNEVLEGISADNLLRIANSENAKVMSTALRNVAMAMKAARRAQADKTDGGLTAEEAAKKE